MFGERIIRARKAAGLSQRALAERLSMSAMAISKYERNEVAPNSKVLLKLAKALNVRVEFFFRSSRIELEQVEYRKRDELKVSEKKRILAEVEERLEQWQELESLLPGGWSRPFKVPSLPRRISSMDEVEAAVLKLRDRWNLGRNPIPDLTDVLEEHGIHVITVAGDRENHFDGLSARCCDGIPVIAIGSGWPGDRQRFTLAHELGHLILHDRIDGDLDEEKAVNRFAGALLAPRDAMFRTLGNKRKVLELQELILLKAEYGMSVQGLLYRAGDLEILNQSAGQQMWTFLRSNGLYDKEIGDPVPPEHSYLFRHRVYRALAEGIIGDGKASELLGISLADLRKCRHEECSLNASDQ